MIKINDLNYKIYDNKILQNINLKIDENEVVVIVGANGSGKTTLIKCIASILNYCGEIKVNNLNLKRLKHREKAKVVSYLPQHAIKTNIKVKTLIKHGRYAHLRLDDKLSDKDKLYIEKAIDIVGIRGILHKNLFEISGGERQLSYLGMVLAQGTDVILMDEPNTFLDISHQLELLEIIKNLKQQGKTIVIVLHDLIQALEIADRVVVMQNGQVKAFDKPENVLDDIKDAFNVQLRKQNDINENSLFKYILVKG